MASDTGAAGDPEWEDDLDAGDVADFSDGDLEGEFDEQDADEDDFEDDEYEDEYEDGEYEDEAEDEDDPDEYEDFAPREVAQTLTFGLVAMAPLVLAYEVTLALDGAGGARSVAEAVLSLPLRPLAPDTAAVARRAGLVVMLLLALMVSARRTEKLVRRVFEVILEGAVFALLLGPLLAFASGYVEPILGPVAQGAAEGPTDLARIAIAAGGAAYEEVLFRVLVLSLVFVAARWVFDRVFAGPRTATVCAVLVGSGASAVAFASIHVDQCVAWLGTGGEPFQAASFAWRSIAGMALAGIVLWRGVGVGAWAHALFNLARILGWS